jgi:hypothetical protein
MLFLSVHGVVVLLVLFLHLFGMMLVGSWIKTGSLCQLPTQTHIPPEAGVSSFITFNCNIVIKITTMKDIQITLEEGEEKKETNANDKMEGSG